MRLLPIPLLFVACLASGQDAPPPPALQPVPDGAPNAPSQGDEFEPEVTIIRRQGTTVEEYRTNGRLYMVRVIPDVGVPSYLVDVDGVVVDEGVGDGAEAEVVGDQADGARGLGRVVGALRPVLELPVRLLAPSLALILAISALHAVIL